MRKRKNGRSQQGGGAEGVRSTYFGGEELRAIGVSGKEKWLRKAKAVSKNEAVRRKMKIRTRY